jgi:nucleotide-binding universal stress UspA family protein
MYNRILVPLDGSVLSESSLAHVQAIARERQGSDVVLLTVLEQLKAGFPESIYGVTSLKQVHEEFAKANKQIRQNAENYLDSKAGDLTKAGLIVKTVVIQSDSEKGAADIIIDYAKANKVDLIVMSTHGRSGISRWTLGSVTDKVIRHAGVPVLTIARESHQP